MTPGIASSGAGKREYRARSRVPQTQASTQGRVGDRSVANQTCYCFCLQAEDGIRDLTVTGVQTCALPISIYAADGFSAGQPFPGNTIPADLIDQNAVRELNAGTFPHPNLGTRQFISSIPQKTNVREDIVRIDHNINSKFQLMGHYLHDAVTQTYYPPLWGNSTYPTVGTAMLNPSWSSTLKLTQTYSPSLLNETSFLFSGNTIHLSPVKGAGLTTFSQPSGWTATSFFPLANNREARLPEVRLAAPYNTIWSPSYFPWKNSY